MGKKSRMKRESAAAAALALSQRPAAPLMVLAKPARKTVAELVDEINQGLAIEAENEIIDWKNNLPLGHSQNLCRLAQTFDPIEAWMDEMARTGDTEYFGDTAVFKPSEGAEYYPVVDSFMAVCDTYELIARDRKVPDGSGPLRQLAKMIEYAMPISQRELDAAKGAIEWMKEVTKPLTPMQFSEFSVAIQIRATMAETYPLGKYA